MLRRLEPGEKIVTGALGSFCPYWTRVGGDTFVADTAEEIIPVVQEEDRLLDVVAVMETLHWSNPLGERTMVEGIRRMPWRATLTGDGAVMRRPPIPHGTVRAAPEEIARNLRRLLADELRAACADRGRIILTLTGGLDSRVVAGVMKSIEDDLPPITCVTWGTPDSRDVVYAQRIAHWFDWQFTHLEYGPKHLEENLFRAARWGGAEITGLHLHRFPWFERMGRRDLVIMASFGDSVGRAEFAGTHLTRHRMEPFGNRLALFDPRAALHRYPIAEKDRATAWEGAEREPLTTQLELHNQENFMRRGVCHAADYVRRFCDLHQAFTSDPVVSHMWSIDPRDRVDAVYHHLLHDLDPRLFELPWARTGVAPSGRREEDVSLTKNYHHLVQWLRHEVRGTLTQMFTANDGSDLGVLYPPSVRPLWWAFRWFPRQGTRAVGFVSKIATIRAFCEMYGLRVPEVPRQERPLQLSERRELVRIYGDAARRALSRLMKGS